jgi:NADPH-dependent 2,4-dienoyl-CoA reductase/sulfur reductase-like enzyme
VVVGAGFVGCEVAATCRELGVDVAVVEPLEIPLQRAFGPRAGALVADLHRDNGVDLRLGVAVTDVVEGRDLDGSAVVRAIVLSDGEELACDLLIVAIGVVPATDWLEGSGLLLDDGVVCDTTLSALDVDGVPVPGVVAAGDVARWHHPVFQRLVRVEHWTNAIEQGRHAASTLLAPPHARLPFAEIPFFWSKQYGQLIQFVGLPGPEEVELEPSGRSRVITYSEDGRLTGALVVNGPRHVRGYRDEVVAAHSDRLVAELVRPPA